MTTSSDRGAADVTDEPAPADPSAERSAGRSAQRSAEVPAEPAERSAQRYAQAPAGGRPSPEAPRHAGGGVGSVAGSYPPARFALLALAGFSLVVTGGLLRGLGSRMAEGNLPDAMHYTWWLGWTVHALGNLDNPLVTGTMNWPQGVSAMNNTTLLLPAVVLSPVTALAGPLVTLNLLNVLAIPACLAGGYWAARRIGLRPAASVAAAAVFGFAPAVVNSLVGHITMAFAPGLPVLVVLSVDAWRGRGVEVGGGEGSNGWTPRRTGVVLGLVATAQVFTGEEVLFQAGLGAAIVLVVAALSRPREVRAGAARFARTLGVALAVFLPVTAYPLWLQFFGPLAHHGNPFLKDYYAADLTGFWTPTDRLWLHSAEAAARAATFPGGIEEHLAYLGWPLLITCVAVTLWRWRDDVRVRCAAVGLFAAATLSLGGRLWVGGVWTQATGPYAVLQKFPVVEASLASRLGLLAALFAAALLGLAVDAVLRSRNEWRRVAAVLLAAACLAPLLPRPLTTLAAPQVPAYFADGDRYITGDPVLVVLPYAWAGQPVAMRWQSESGYRFRMPGGYFLGPGPDGHAYVGGDADLPTAELLRTVATEGVPHEVTPAEQEQARADLRTWGADAVVLGPDATSELLRTTVTALLGREPERLGGVDVWRASS